MKFLGIDVDIKNIPVLDPGFIPLHRFNEAFLKTAKEPIAIALERDGGQIAVTDTFIHGTENMYPADCYYIDRLVKFLLWSRGGYRIFICGSERMADYIKAAYSPEGTRAFDSNFMTRVYEHPFEVVSLPYEKKPTEFQQSKPLGRNLDGCRIGFDAGGSDRKVSAVIDGKAVYSEEVVWFPKTNADPDYHFEGILAAFRAAAEKMPRVDAIGISSAGVYVNNRTMVASLFIKVPDDLFESKVKDIYLRAAREIGPDIPVEVANDGDVTALAGAMSLDDNCVLGIAMGTSEAAGFVDADGNITGWLNELAFAPVDTQADAMIDEWSGDIGCGVKYFSQDGVIKLAPRAGIELDPALSPAEKLKVVQKLAEESDERALKVFETIGSYLGHTIPLYADHYDIRHMLLLGRVMSGIGGNVILGGAQSVLSSEYPKLAAKIQLHLPDEKSRRVGQSVAAASLPKIQK
ncbi:MAG: ROK family protein [Clostridiales bacterium]|nr:ROK family protein [Clostridiales bacterium]